MHGKERKGRIQGWNEKPWIEDPHLGWLYFFSSPPFGKGNCMNGEPRLWFRFRPEWYPYFDTIHIYKADTLNASCTLVSTYVGNRVTHWVESCATLVDVWGREGLDRSRSAAPLEPRGVGTTSAPTRQFWTLNPYRKMIEIRASIGAGCFPAQVPVDRWIDVPCGGWFFNLYSGVLCSLHSLPNSVSENLVCLLLGGT